MNDVYTRILNESRTQVFKREQDSRDWFRERAFSVNRSQVAPTKVIEEHGKKISSINQASHIGKLFLYNYMPKHRKELPFYDTFPIVFPFRIVKGGFYGLNLHYLPYTYRAILMDSLYSLSNSRDFSKNSTRLQSLTYKVLESKRTLKFFSPCVHSYLHANVRSKIIMIPPSEWELALFLPLQRFQKKSQDAVWRDSVNQINKKRNA